MHTITVCPRCNNDFMFHATDIHLHRVTAFDADTKEPCSFETICQDCDDKETITKLKELKEKINRIFQTDLGQQLNELYITSDGKPFIRKEEAENYCHDILEEGNDKSKYKIDVWYPDDFTDITNIEEGNYIGNDNELLNIF